MIVLLISVLISFVTTFFVTPHFIKFLCTTGIVGLDLQKKNKPMALMFVALIILTAAAITATLMFT